MTNIDPKAVVDRSAELADDVEVGPYSVIGPDVRLGPGTRVGSHVVIHGPSRIGRDNIFHPMSVIGGDPQDLKYDGEKTVLEIGDGNIFREFVTIHRGTEKGGGITRIGNRNFFLTESHVAHDCLLEDDIVLSAKTGLAGHVKVESYVIINGMTGVNQFVTLGRHAFLGGMSRVVQDVPPFMISEGNPTELLGINRVGLARRGFSKERIESLKTAYRILYRSGLPRREAIAKILALPGIGEEERYLVEFLERMEKGRFGRARESAPAVVSPSGRAVNS